MISIQQKNIPAELKERPQWLIWRYIQRPDRPKPDKVPHTTMGYRADVTNPDHWSTFEFALKIALLPGFCDGMGIAFTETDPYCGIDLDNVWQSDADEGAPWATGIFEKFSDTYTEESPSGRGLKIWCKAKVSHCGSWPIQAGKIEIYDRSRFFTVTTKSNGILTVADHQSDLEALVRNLDRFTGRGRADGHKPVSVISQRIPAGQRHSMLVSLAGSLWRRGLDPEEIEIALMAVNRRRCDPPHSAEHVRKLVGSIGRWNR
jgi:primase-polymerase (primpol)-like protein